MYFSADDDDDGGGGNNDVNNGDNRKRVIDLMRVKHEKSEKLFGCGIRCEFFTSM